MECPWRKKGRLNFEKHFSWPLTAAKVCTSIKRNLDRKYNKAMGISVVIPVLSLQEISEDLILDIEKNAQVKEIIVVEARSQGDAAPAFSTDDRAHEKSLLRVNAKESGEAFLTSNGLRALVSKDYFVYQAERGKSKQINFGIFWAREPFVWVIHADSRVTIYSPSFFSSLDPFRLYYGDLSFYGAPGFLMRLNAFGVWLRCKLWGMPFGDQGLLFHKDLFDNLGGYAEEVTLGESHLFAWKAQREGFKVARGRYHIRTSARKYEESGWLKMTLFHVAETFRQMKRFRC